MSDTMAKAKCTAKSINDIACKETVRFEAHKLGCILFALLIISLLLILYIINIQVAGFADLVAEQNDIYCNVALMYRIYV